MNKDHLAETAAALTSKYLIIKIVWLPKLNLWTLTMTFVLLQRKWFRRLKEDCELLTVGQGKSENRSWRK